MESLALNVVKQLQSSFTLTKHTKLIQKLKKESMKPK